MQQTYQTKAITVQCSLTIRKFPHTIKSLSLKLPSQNYTSLTHLSQNILSVKGLKTVHLSHVASLITSVPNCPSKHYASRQTLALDSPYTASETSHTAGRQL